MSSSPNEAFCTKKTLHIIPSEWTAYPMAALDCIIYSGIKEHYNHYKTVKGASITVGEVSATAKRYEDRVWMCRESDQSKKPSAPEYSLAWIDNYACKHK
uniref:Uncharacterized protein n=1 Tax=Glyptapanteles indiensis TaxID=92994 RepID=B7S925_GLYIN|nr:hypothetical protein GIP_L8_0140 [Glyptapanteles indiensis]